MLEGAFIQEAIASLSRTRRSLLLGILFRQPPGLEVPCSHSLLCAPYIAPCRSRTCLTGIFSPHSTAELPAHIDKARFPMIIFKLVVVDHVAVRAFTSRRLLSASPRTQSRKGSSLMSEQIAVGVFLSAIVSTSKRKITEKKLRTHPSPQLFCFFSLSFINSVNESGEMTFIIGPKESILMTISVSSYLSYLSDTRYLLLSILSALFSK